MENNCKWLSDSFTAICCCGENKTYCADACPFLRRPTEAECRFYEEYVVAHDCVTFKANGGTCRGCTHEDCCPFYEER